MPDEESAQSEMPKYKCHKEVWALKIASLEPLYPGGVGSKTRIHFQDPGYASIEVDSEYVRKHNPSQGGYYVVYADGYQSFSPAKAFEEGYTKL